MEACGAMKRPSFQFYPGDWSANPNLKRCTFAEKGIWLEVMCLMHDQAEYGVLRWPLKEVAEAVKCRTAELQALVRKGVLKGDDKLLEAPFVYVPRSGRKDGDPVTLLPTQPGPVWYSSRMVKDEYVRTIRGEGTRFGDGNGDGNGDAPKRSPKTTLGDGPSSSSSSPSSSPPSVNVGVDPPVVGTPYGAIAKALRQAGIEASPGTLRFRTLVDAGATTEEFLAMVPDAIDKDKPFAYLLGAVEGERKRAANTARQLHHGPMPQAPPPRQSATERQIATMNALTGKDRDHDRHRAPAADTIDVAVRVVP